MESHRIIICLALFVACIMAVQSAAIETPAVPAVPQQPLANEAEPQPSGGEHTREKKYALGYYGYYPGFSAYSYHPTAYSSYSYYPSYHRTLPVYSPYIY